MGGHASNHKKSKRENTLNTALSSIALVTTNMPISKMEKRYQSAIPTLVSVPHSSHLAAMI
jgi:hypothetical protein